MQTTELVSFKLGTKIQDDGGNEPVRLFKSIWPNVAILLQFDIFQKYANFGPYTENGARDNKSLYNRSGVVMGGSRISGPPPP